MNDYTELDVWLKENPEKSYPAFKAEYPAASGKISQWSFFRRKRKLKSGFSKSFKRTGRIKRPYTRRVVNAVYNTPWRISFEDIEKKSKIEILQDLVTQLNIQFKLHMQVTEVTLVGENNKRILELRRYTR
jgi:hypothetical protein